nr:UvrD-helicase domain-containing protein [Rodentibacter pneumotropicus]
MNKKQRVIVTPTFWGKLFGRIKSVEFQQNKVIVTGKKNNIAEYNLGKTLEFPILENAFFGNKLSFKDDNKEVVLSKLAKKQTNSLLLEIEKAVASNIQVKVKEAFQQFTNLAENQYLRDSDIPTLNDHVRWSVVSYGNNKEHFQKYFDESFVKKIKYISSLFPIDIKNAQTIRKKYEQYILNHRKHFFDVIESNPLTEQQRLSVIRSNDINMVLAAAGTGKTSVMVAKALDLIDSGACRSEDILILAYNRDAATELSERLQERAREANLDLENSPSISTFHALGRRIIKECGKSVHLSKFAEDPMKLDRWFNKWLENYIKEDPDNLAKFIQLAYQPIDPFQFKTKKEYDRYVNDNDYRTLQGERVRGYQELLIANWLFSHSVKYEYEPRYVSKRRIEVGFDYKPDFSLGDGVYLEHFGIDRQGRTRADINAQEYNANIQRKRELHSEHNTTLLETYHYNWVENTLYKRLEQLMNEQFIPLKPKSQQEILDALNESGIFKENKNRYLKCLQAIRTERLDYQQILKRLTDAKIVYAKEYATLLMRIHDAYVKELRSVNEIDFDDMILLATQLVKTAEFKPKWKHILVDEFQDISMARLELLKEIYTKGPRPIWTVVGDDWQSIYRFSGGKLEVTTRFNDMVGSHTLSKLEKTYRYNNSIELNFFVH